MNLPQSRSAVLTVCTQALLWSISLGQHIHSSTKMLFPTAVIILQTAFFLGSFNTSLDASKEHVLVYLHARLEGINFQLGKVYFLSTVFPLNV